MGGPKLSIPNQIKRMKNKGIGFTIASESTAKRFLEYNNYYYKLKAYAHNFDIYRNGEKKGQYINLDFAYLIDLSTIDARLRKIILCLAIDLEHFLKVKMLSDFNKTDEDGYDIIGVFLPRIQAVEIKLKPNQILPLVAASLKSTNSIGLSGILLRLCRSGNS